MGGYAWVTLATNNSYSLGALVLAHSLKKANTAHKLAVLITPAVSQSMREQLQSVFDLVKVVDVLDSKDEAHLALMKRPELGITFTKIHCWRLVEFEKCVFLDADTLVVRNCDELFEKEEFSAAPDASWPDCFNSGVFVFRPSVETFNKILQFAVENRSFDGGDQGLLNQFFSQWATEDIKKHLPFVYNLTSIAAYSYIPAFKHYGAETRIVHFIGQGKPWLQQLDATTRTVTPSPGSEHLAPLLQQWWDLFCEKVHPGLDKNLESFNDGMSHPPVEVNFLPVALTDEPQTALLIEPCTPYREKDDFRQHNLPYLPFNVEGPSGELLNVEFLLASVVPPAETELSVNEQQRQEEEKNEERWDEQKHEENGNEREEGNAEANHQQQEESNTTEIEEMKSEEEGNQHREEDPPPPKDPFDYNTFFPDETCISSYLEKNVETYQPFDSQHHNSSGDLEPEQNSPPLPRFLTIPQDDKRQSGNVETHSQEEEQQHRSEPVQPRSKPPQSGSQSPQERTEPPRDPPIEPPRARTPPKEKPPPKEYNEIEPEKRELSKSKSTSSVPWEVETAETPPRRSIWKSQPDLNGNPNRRYSMPKLKPILPRQRSFSKSVPSAMPKVTLYTEFVISSEYKDPVDLPNDKIDFVETHIRKETKPRRSKSEADIKGRFGPLPYIPSPEVEKPVVRRRVPPRHFDECYDLAQCKRQMGNKPKPKDAERRKDSIHALPALKPIVPVKDKKPTLIKKRKLKELSPGDGGKEKVAKREPKKPREKKREPTVTPRNVSTNSSSLDEILERLKDFSKDYQHFFGVGLKSKAVTRKNARVQTSEEGGGECEFSEVFHAVSTPVSSRSKETQTPKKTAPPVEGLEFRQFRIFVTDQKETSQKGLLGIQDILSSRHSPEILMKSSTPEIYRLDRDQSKIKDDVQSSPAGVSTPRSLVQKQQDNSGSIPTPTDCKDNNTNDNLSQPLEANPLNSVTTETPKHSKPETLRHFNETRDIPENENANNSEKEHSEDHVISPNSVLESPVNRKLSDDEERIITNSECPAVAAGNSTETGESASESVVEKSYQEPKLKEQITADEDSREKTKGSKDDEHSTESVTNCCSSAIKQEKDIGGLDIRVSDEESSKLDEYSKKETKGPVSDEHSTESVPTHFGFTAQQEEETESISGRVSVKESLEVKMEEKISNEDGNVEPSTESAAQQKENVEGLSDRIEQKNIEKSIQSELKNGESVNFIKTNGVAERSFDEERNRTQMVRTEQQNGHVMQANGPPKQEPTGEANDDEQKIIGNEKGTKAENPSAGEILCVPDFETPRSSRVSPPTVTETQETPQKAQTAPVQTLTNGHTNDHGAPDDSPDGPAGRKSPSPNPSSAFRHGNAQRKGLQDLKNASGIAGAIAQLSLESGAEQTPGAAAASSAHEEYLRRQNWETGNMDYMGKDSFDNIWSKICQTIEAKDVDEKAAGSPQPPTGTPAAVAKAPAESPAAPEKCPEFIETLPGEPAAGPLEDDEIIFSKPEKRQSSLTNIKEEEEAKSGDSGAVGTKEVILKSTVPQGVDVKPPEANAAAIETNVRSDAVVGKPQAEPKAGTPQTPTLPQPAIEQKAETMSGSVEPKPQVGPESKTATETPRPAAGEQKLPEAKVHLQDINSQPQPEKPEIKAAPPTSAPSAGGAPEVNPQATSPSQEVKSHQQPEPEVPPKAPQTPSAVTETKPQDQSPLQPQPLLVKAEDKATPTAETAKLPASTLQETKSQPEPQKEEGKTAAASQTPSPAKEMKPQATFPPQDAKAQVEPVKPESKVTPTVPQTQPAAAESKPQPAVPPQEIKPQSDLQKPGCTPAAAAPQTPGQPTAAESKPEPEKQEKEIAGITSPETPFPAAATVPQPSSPAKPVVGQSEAKPQSTFPPLETKSLTEPAKPTAQKPATVEAKPQPTTPLQEAKPKPEDEKPAPQQAADGQQQPPVCKTVAVMPQPLTPSSAGQQQPELMKDSAAAPQPEKQTAECKTVAIPSPPIVFPGAPFSEKDKKQTRGKGIEERPQVVSEPIPLPAPETPPPASTQAQEAKEEGKTKKGVFSKLLEMVGVAPKEKNGGESVSRTVFYDAVEAPQATETEQAQIAEEVVKPQPEIPTEAPKPEETTGKSAAEQKSASKEGEKITEEKSGEEQKKQSPIPKPARKSPSPMVMMPQKPPETAVTMPTPPPQPDVPPRKNSGLLKVDDTILETPPVVGEPPKEGIIDVKGKATTEIEDIIGKAKSEVETLIQEAGESSDMINAMKLMMGGEQTGKETEVEELRVTCEEERMRHKGEVVSSKLSDQILKAIPPPRRKAISEASASTSAIPKPTASEPKTSTAEGKPKSAGKPSSIPVPPPRNKGKPGPPEPPKPKGKK